MEIQQEEELGEDLVEELPTRKVEMPAQVELQTNLMKHQLGKKDLQMLAQVEHMIQTWRC
jgi:hypothetical protein